MAEETVTEFAEYLHGNLSALDQKQPIVENAIKHGIRKKKNGGPKYEKSPA